MNTRIDYLYRDGSNYKFPHHAIVKGEITEDQKKRILNSLDDGIWFVPSKVGFECDYATGYEPNEDDHPFCELDDDSFSFTDEDPRNTEFEMTVDGLVMLFEKPLWVCVYADTAGIFPEEEMNAHDMCYLPFPYEIVKAYFDNSGRSDEDPDFDVWFKKEYTCDDTHDLCWYAEDQYGYRPPREMVDWFA